VRKWVKDCLNRARIKVLNAWKFHKNGRGFGACFLGKVEKLKAVYMCTLVQFDIHYSVKANLVPLDFFVGTNSKKMVATA